MGLRHIKQRTILREVFQCLISKRKTPRHPSERVGNIQQLTQIHLTAGTHLFRIHDVLSYRTERLRTQVLVPMLLRQGHAAQDVLHVIVSQLIINVFRIATQKIKPC